MAMEHSAGLTPLHNDDPESLESRWGIRKIVTETIETNADGDDSLSAPITQAWAAAIVTNPWTRKSATDVDLVNAPKEIAARLSKLLSDRLNQALGGATNIKAFGKGAIIGDRGALEHGAALTHTPYFASNLRNFFEGSAVISFADTRGSAGEPLVIPLCEKNTGIKRDFYQALTVRLADAPRGDEIVLVAAASTGPRPFPGVGDRTTDKPLDQEVLNGAFQ